MLDSAGRGVRTLLPQGGGWNGFCRDGRLENRAEAAAAIYYLRVLRGKAEATRTVVRPR